MSLRLLFHSDILPIATDGTPAWVRFRGEQSARVLTDGSLILGLADMRSDTASSVIEEWAEYNRFSLDGVDPQAALTSLLWATVMQAVNDADDYDDIADRMRNVTSRTAQSSAPDFRLRIDAGYIANRLIEVFDRPSDDDEAAAAFHRRTNRAYFRDDKHRD